MEKGTWVTPDGKEHKGVFYGGHPDGNRYYSVPGLKTGPNGEMHGHWVSEGEVTEAPGIKYARGEE